MNNIRQKRIIYELSQIHKKQGENGIYYHYDDEDINTVYAMIVGPVDTPYHLGFYLFKAKYPENYPFTPMKVTFLTTEPHVRMNPNLYGSGKVCLSILGTWSGPSWTSVMNLFSIFTSIVAEIFVPEPFKNEPGQRMSSDAVNEIYKNYLYHENLRLAIVSNILNPTYSKPFMEYIHKYILDNREAYIKLYEFYKKQDQMHRYLIEFTTPSLWSKYRYANIYPTLLDNFKEILMTLSINTN